MRIFDISIKNKLLINFLLMVGGLLVISAISTYDMLGFKDVLNNLIYNSNQRNIYYKQLQYQLAQYQGAFAELSTASNPEMIEALDFKVGAVTQELDDIIDSLQRLAPVSENIKNAGPELKLLFAQVREVQEQRLKMREDKQVLNQSLFAQIEESKRSLLTILDNNELAIFMASQQMSGQEGDFGPMIDDFMHKHHTPIMEVLSIITRMNELAVQASTVDAVDEADFLKPKEERIISGLSAIEGRIPELMKGLDSEDKALLSGVQASMELIYSMLLGEEGVIAKHSNILASRKEYGILMGAAEMRVRQIVNEAEEVSKKIGKDARTKSDQTLGSLTRILLTIIGVFAVILIVGGTLSLMLIRSIAHPLTKGVSFAKAVSQGDMSATLDLKRKDEIGNLAEALNSMVKNLSRQDWLKNGKSELDDSLRGVERTGDLASKCITFMAKYLEAQLGALYVLNEDEQVLELRASYAFTDRHGNFNRITMGEGLVGQVALEMQSIVFSNVVEDVPLLNYGMGEKPPQHFFISPIVYQNELIGVMQLGAVTPFTELKREFVKQSLDGVAATFNVARSRGRIQELLTHTQAQTDELQAREEALTLSNKELEDQAKALRESESALQQQQEELRATNEELEEQTKILRKAQTELQQQQEELRVTNEELEERTKALEVQRNAIRAKNVELKKAQTDVERKARELEMASRYKSEFLANMSHELRTPLNSILILSQLLAGGNNENLTDKQQEFATTINSSGKDLLSLINEILDLAKVESGKIEIYLTEYLIRDLVDSMDRLFSPMAHSKNLELVFNVEEGLPESIRTDPKRLQQILRNLLSNAIKFTDEGKIIMTIRRPDGKESLPQRIDPEKSIEISVVDTGIGIPKGKQGLVFEAFKQADGSTSRKYGGTGLGLSISRELAEILGGGIRLKSVEEEGSQFTLFLPETAPETVTVVDSLDVDSAVVRKSSDFDEDDASEEIKAKIFRDAHRPAAKPAAPQEEPVCTPVEDALGDAHIAREERTTKKRERLPENWLETSTRAVSVSYVPDDRKSLTRDDDSLLVIEDDLDFSQRLRELAHEKGFKCLIAENGETGLHFADYFQPNAIVLDITLPGMDGQEVIERLKQNPSTEHIPVHLLSTSDEQLNGMKMGAVGVLKLPLDSQEFESAFSKLSDIAPRPVKQLLIVEDDSTQRMSVQELLSSEDVEVDAVASGEEALAALLERPYDCLILDLGLADMSGFELLETIKHHSSISKVPVIVYTGRDLDHEQQTMLSKYADSIIIKGARSPERLMDETSLFLHSVSCAQGPASRAKAKEQQDKDFILSGKKVMLVDDDMRNLFAIASVLEEKGMEVLEAGDGREALSMLEEHPDLDVIFMDIMMPELDGHETIAEIRKQERFKKVPIIALTAKAMKGDKQKCIEAGANDYLAKPIDNLKLLSLLRVWLH